MKKNSVVSLGQQLSLFSPVSTKEAESIFYQEDEENERNDYLPSKKALPSKKVLMELGNGDLNTGIGFFEKYTWD